MCPGLTRDLPFLRLAFPLLPTHGVWLLDQREACVAAVGRPNLVSRTRNTYRSSDDLMPQYNDGPGTLEFSCLLMHARRHQNMSDFVFLAYRREAMFYSAMTSLISCDDNASQTSKLRNPIYIIFVFFSEEVIQVVNFRSRHSMIVEERPQICDPRCPKRGIKYELQATTLR